KKGQKRQSASRASDSGQSRQRIPSDTSSADIEEKIPTISLPARLLVGGIGLFLTVIAFHNLIGLISGIASGRLSISILGTLRGRGSAVYLWSESHWKFIFAVGAGMLELLICAVFAYGCWRIFVRAPAEKKR